MDSDLQKPRSPVYGPVPSWRHGRSLGIDLILQDSICSFNCVYCQLGSIHQVIDQQGVFVSGSAVITELERVNWDAVDIATFSGSGEPTLALNLGEIVDHVRFTLGKPVLVLTNATWLHDEATRQRLRNASIVECKLDAATDETLRRFNRPAKGIGLERIIEGVKALRTDPDFAGRLTIQTMFMPANVREAEMIADLIAEIGPDEVQLNTPRRPYPREWYLDARGNHGDRESPVETVSLATISEEEAERIERLIRERSGVPIRSIYRRTV